MASQGDPEPEIEQHVSSKEAEVIQQDNEPPLLGEREPEEYEEEGAVGGQI